MADEQPLDETLMRLAQAGVATHHLRFPGGLAADASLDDEVAALEALAELVEGPIYRIDPLSYAFECTGDAQALAAALAEKLGLAEPPPIEPLPVPAATPGEARSRRAADALTLLGALSRPDEALSGERRVVIDAGYAAAAAEATAARIGELVDRLEERLTAGFASAGPAGDGAGEATDDGVIAALARIEAALGGGETASDERLARIEAALDALSAPAGDPGDRDARFDRIEAALAALAPGEDDALPARLARMETALAALAETPAPAPDAAATERLARIEAALAALAALGARETGPNETLARLDRIEAALGDLASAAPAAAPAGDAEEALARLGTIERTLAQIAARPVGADPETAARLTRMETALAALAAAPSRDPVADAATPEALARIEAALAAPAPAADPETGERLGRIEATLAALPAVFPAAPADGGEALARIEAAMAPMAALTERMDALAAEVARLATRPEPVETLSRERDGLTRLISALHTILSRFDGEITRMTEAAGRAGADALGPIASRLDALDGLASRLDVLDGVAGGVDGLAARLDALANAAQPGADAPAPVLDALEALRGEVAALAARPAVGADMHREREGLLRLCSALQTMLSRMDGEITRLVDAAAHNPAQTAETAEALAPRFDGVEAAIARATDEMRAALAEAQAGAEAAPAADAALAAEIIAEVRALASRPAAPLDLHREREGLVRLSSALQTLLGRMDGEITRLVEAQAHAPASAETLAAALTDRLGAVERAVEDAAASLREAVEALPRDAGPDADALLSEVRALAERPTIQIDLHREREGLLRLSSALQTMLSRMDGEISRLLAASDAMGASEEAGALAAAVAERLDALEARLGEIAAAQGGGDVAAAAAELRAALERHGGAGAVDLRRERESLARLSFGLQTVASRLEAEVARLAETDRDDAGLDADTLRAALAPLADQLAAVGERIESAAGLGADHSAALVDMVQRVREECAELHGLHARYMETGAGGGGDAAEALMERVSATLAEFLARMERVESARAATARAAAPRLGRAM